MRVVQKTVLQILESSEHNQPMSHFRFVVVVLAQIHWSFLQVALNSFRKRCSKLFYPLLCTSFAIKKTMIMGKMSRLFYHKTKLSAKQQKHWINECFLKEFKAKCKDSSESELKQQKAI